MKRRLEVIKSMNGGKDGPVKGHRLLTFQGAVKKAEDAPDGEGKFFVEGYASSGSTDTYGDKISDAALKQLAAELPSLVLLHNHDPDQQLGMVREAKFDEEKHAVWVSCEVMDAVAKEKVSDGRLNSFSIRAYASDWAVHETAENHWVEILAWERVIELSLTSVPVQAEAKVTGWVIKSLATDPVLDLRIRRLEMKAAMPIIKAEASMVEYLTQVAAALRAITTEDTAASEAMAAIATSVEEKAAAEQAILDEEGQEEESEAAAGKPDGEAGEAAKAIAPAVAIEEFKALGDKVAALETALASATTALTDLLAKVAGLATDHETAKGETEKLATKVLSTFKSLEQRLEVVSGINGDAGSQPKPEKSSAMAGLIFK